MAMYKCKMCGAQLEVLDGQTVVECDYCGTRQTVPTVDKDEIRALFNRANTLRMNKEFDRASELYEKIIGRDGGEAEAYWGVILCKYGIEYVEDPSSYKRVPTCHRTSYESVTSDSYYLSAVANADAVQKTVYEAEARAIDIIQRDILAISEREEPYDIFICYKETDELKQRTKDSGIANELYYQLTDEGYKVFFAPVTLRDKAGQNYEPYIFAALSSAKVMIVIGTKPEFFNAVWVKNEWSRFLKMMDSDRGKKLIPCYQDMDAYELPDEFAHLHAQNMSGMGFVRELIRGIKTVIVKEEKRTAPVTQTVVSFGDGESTDIEATVRRAFLFLEDEEWESAASYAERALDIAPEYGKAYLARAMAELRITTVEALKRSLDKAKENRAFIHAAEYDPEIKAMAEAAAIAAAEGKRREEEQLRAAEEARREAEAALQRKAEEEARQKGEILKSKRSKLEKYQQLLGAIVDCTVSQIGGEVRGQGWSDVKGSGFKAEIKDDGTVLLSPDDPQLTWYDWSYGGYRKIDYIYADDWKGWKAISSLTAYKSYLYAVTEDGRILSNGGDYYYQYEWGLDKKIHDTLFAVLGNECIAILRADGRACFYGIKYWKAYDDGIVAIGARDGYVYFMSESGEVKQYDSNGPKVVAKVDLKNKSVEELLRENTVKKAETESAERIKEAEAAEQRKKEEELRAWRRGIKVCQYCSGDFKGVFEKVCKSCGRKKDY